MIRINGLYITNGMCNPDRLGPFHYIQSQGKAEILNYMVYKNQKDLFHTEK